MPSPQKFTVQWSSEVSAGTHAQAAFAVFIANFKHALANQRGVFSVVALHAPAQDSVCIADVLSGAEDRSQKQATYRVCWEIEVEALSARNAARQACWECLQSWHSNRKFQVSSATAAAQVFDLSDDFEEDCYA